MKKTLKAVLAALFIVAMLCNFASAEMVTTTAAAADPKYTAKADFDPEELLLSGTVEHTEGTPEVEGRLYVRITYFMADGSYMVVPAVVTEDFSFESMISGSILHIAIQVVNSAKVVPGTYVRYGGYEFDVK